MTILGEVIAHEYKDGAMIEYEDYDVDWFGGMDFECHYWFDAPNAKKLRHYLEQELDVVGKKVPFQDLIITKYGINFNLNKPTEDWEKAGIAYGQHSDTWK